MPWTFKQCTQHMYQIKSWIILLIKKYNKNENHFQIH